ncbi:MAG TPA: energy transducer TonB [Bryobacteraceae bacterium]|nr:energy transducer TonB [Bryobacteraceae bacterium]
MSTNTHNRYDADMAAHDANGNVKLSLEADDHLGRLLAPNTEIPWFKSIIQNFREMLHPEELPPLELTSKPIEVKDLWGQGTNPKRVLASVLIHAGVFAALILIGTNPVVQKAVAHVVLIAPPPPPKQVVEVKPQPPAGGSPRAMVAEAKPAAPKAAPRTFTPPLVTIEHPALTMDASLVAAPDAWAAPSGAIGNPLGAIGGGGGLGTGTGGTGKGTGTGNGNGNAAGSGGQVYNAGNGVSNPTLVSQVQPEYSDEARKDRITGFVTLAIVVDTKGKATDIKIVKSLGDGLDEKAIEAVQKWVFRPGLMRGAPVAVRAQVQVSFTLL